MTNRPQTAATASEFHLAIPEDRYGELMETLYPPEGHPYRDLPERGAIAVVTRSTGRKRVTYTVHEVIKPNPDDPRDAVNISGSGLSAGLEFGHRYRSRAIDRAIELSNELVRSQRAGLLLIHTHPDLSGIDRSPRPSTIDEQSALENMRRYASHIGWIDDGPLPPMAAAIVTAKEDGHNGAKPGDEEWAVRGYEYERLGDGTLGEDPTITWAHAVRIVGYDDAHPGSRVLTKYTADRGPDHDLALGPAGGLGSFNADVMDASTALWGGAGQEVLAGLRVGLVGCGGVGSILAEQVAQDGVAELVATDFDIIEDSNRNRMEGATAEDVDEKRQKVYHACELADDTATHPDFVSRPVYGSIVEDDAEYAAIPDLIDCDIILLAADTADARRVADELAYAHCIPVINGGAWVPSASEDISSQIAADGRPSVLLHHGAVCEVQDAGPGTECLRCQGLYEPAESGQVPAYDALPDGEKNRGADVEAEGADGDETDRDAAVKAPNQIVSGRMGIRLRSYVLGLMDRQCGSWRHFLRTGSSDWKPPNPNEALCGADCDRPEITGLGDGYRLSTKRDEIFRNSQDE